MTARIIQGDCRDVLKTLDAESVHAVVTDPPYHLTSTNRGSTPGSVAASRDVFARVKAGGFMGMKWDGGDVALRPETWAEVLRVLKPGGYLLAFGGTRTYHRLVCAIEDAGFEVRDMIAWLYGSGFPKGTDKAKIPPEFAGFNTALKPAIEPIVVARKPMIGTLAENLQAHGCGAMNVDGCRIEAAGRPLRELDAKDTNSSVYVGRVNGGAGFQGGSRAIGETDLGRWPANVVHDGSEEVLAAFPDAPGQMGNVTGDEPSTPAKNVYGTFSRSVASNLRGDRGSAARFFYCAKASRKDRNHGVEDMPEKALNWSSGEQNPGAFQSPNTNRSAQNHHPTVKPTELMTWLVKLVTPPGGTVLDPFMGSGSTGRGAALGGFDFIGIEMDAEYLEIARGRIQVVAPPFEAVELSQPAPARQCDRGVKTG